MNMDFLLIIFYLALIYFIPYSIYWVISTALKKRKEAIREEVIAEILKEKPNIKQDIKFYYEKIKKTGFDIEDPIKKEVDEYYKYYLSRKHNKLFDKCPECNSGYLTSRKGTYGKFIGCSSFPECKFTLSKQKYKEDLEKLFMKDLHTAYNLK